MLRLSVLLVCAAVSCYDLFEDPNGLGLSWLFNEENENNVTTRRLVNLLRDLESRAFANQEAPGQDMNTRDYDDNYIFGYSEDDDLTSEFASNRVNARDEDDLRDLERRMHWEQLPADLDIGERDDDDIDEDSYSQDEYGLGDQPETNSVYTRDLSYLTDMDLEIDARNDGDDAKEYQDLELVDLEYDGSDDVVETRGYGEYDDDEGGAEVSRRFFPNRFQNRFRNRFGSRFRNRHRSRPRKQGTDTFVRKQLSRIIAMLSGRKAGAFRSRPQPLIPDYFYNFTVTDQVYGEIDYSAARSQIEDAVRNSIQARSNLRRALAPVLYNLRGACTVNLLQRLLAVGFNNWSRNTTAQIVEERLENQGGTNDTRIKRLIETVNQLISSEINRTIFDSEFKKFEGVLDFIGQALAKNRNLDPAELVYNMSSYMLQCTPRSTFLEDFIVRTNSLRSRLLDIEPGTFTARVLRSVPGLCGQQAQDAFSRTLFVVRKILPPIQERLDELIQSLYEALVFQTDEPIEDLFRNLLSPFELGVLRNVLEKLQADSPATRSVRGYQDRPDATLLERLIKSLEV